MAINFNQEYCTGTKSIITIAGKEYLSSNSVLFEKNLKSATYSGNSRVYWDYSHRAYGYQSSESFRVVVEDYTDADKNDYKIFGYTGTDDLLYYMVAWGVPVWGHVIEGATIKFYYDDDRVNPTKKIFNGSIQAVSAKAGVRQITSVDNRWNFAGHYGVICPWKKAKIYNSNNQLVRTDKFTDYIALDYGNIINEEVETIIKIDGKRMILPNIDTEQITVTCKPLDFNPSPNNPFSPPKPDLECKCDNDLYPCQYVKNSNNTGYRRIR